MQHEIKISNFLQNEMIKNAFYLFCFFILLMVGCSTSSNDEKNEHTAAKDVETVVNKTDTLLYETEKLCISFLRPQVYLHTSYLKTESFGLVPCNGMLLVNEGEAVVFDSPTDDAAAGELIRFVKENLNASIKAVVATHFHADCIGGLDEFHDHDIPSFAHQKTLDILTEKGGSATMPKQGFEDEFVFKIGGKEVLTSFFGEGHTLDNIVGYFPHAQTIFGGCLIKEPGAGKGNLEDANTAAWSATVRKLKARYPDAELVIPGHGKAGGQDLLNYTIGMFE